MAHADAGYLRLQTHSEYVTTAFFHGRSGYANAPQCHVDTHIAYVVCMCIRLSAPPSPAQQLALRST